MTELHHFVSVIVMALGLFFLLVGSIGVVRLPDFFSRIHATGKSDTLGIMLSLGGLALFEGLTLDGVKLLLAIVFIGLTSPVGTHALVKAAYRFGLKPWFRTDDHESR
jgi:multicomponent Na+:H+ antiporter subunit G